MEKFEVKKVNQQTDQEEEIAEQSGDSIFAIKEIRIGKLAIDGMCGVY